MQNMRFHALANKLGKTFLLSLLTLLVTTKQNKTILARCNVRSKLHATSKVLNSVEFLHSLLEVVVRQLFMQTKSLQSNILSQVGWRCKIFPVEERQKLQSAFKAVV